MEQSSRDLISSKNSSEQRIEFTLFHLRLEMSSNNKSCCLRFDRISKESFALILSNCSMASNNILCDLAFVGLFYLFGTNGICKWRYIHELSNSKYVLIFFHRKGVKLSFFILPFSHGNFRDKMVFFCLGFEFITVKFGKL